MTKAMGYFVRMEYVSVCIILEGFSDELEPKIVQHLYHTLQIDASTNIARFC